MASNKGDWSLEKVRAEISTLSDDERAQLSADWLSQLDAAKFADPWIVGFRMRLRDCNRVVGQCGFKGPSTGEGIVEIAYAVEPESQGRGYAADAGQGLFSTQKLA